MTTSSTHPEARLMRRASDQHGVFTMEQGIADGVPRATMLRLIQQGRLNRIVLTVLSYASGLDALSHEGRCMAALLNAGSDAEIGYESAAELLQLWPSWRRQDHRVHVVTPDRSRSYRDWIAPHRRTHDKHALAPCAHDGIRVTPFPQLVVDLGTILTPYQIAYVLNEAAVRRLVDVHAIRELLHELAGFRGVGRARHALELFEAGSTGSRSPSEDAAIAEIIRRGLPVPLVCVPGAAGIPGVELDLVWDEFGVVLEIDGADYHSRPRDLLRDQAIDRELAASHWIMIREPAWKIRYRMHEVMRKVVLALTSRGFRP